MLPHTCVLPTFYEVVIFFVLLLSDVSLFFFFFFNDTATTEIYTLSLHDALPICEQGRAEDRSLRDRIEDRAHQQNGSDSRSEEHTSELQSQSNLVCRLLLEKKKKEMNLLFIKKLHHTYPRPHYTPYTAQHHHASD